MDFRLTLQLVFLIVLACIYGAYARCKAGEPKNEVEHARQPDLNITLSSGSVAYVGDELRITCTADKPRYHFPQVLQMPPAQVKLFFKGEEVKSGCDGTGGRIVCVNTVQLTEAAINVSVSCLARNSGGDCRTKTLYLKIVEKPNEKFNSTNSSRMFTPTQLMPSSSLKMNSNSSLMTSSSTTPHSTLLLATVEMKSLSFVVKNNFSLHATAIASSATTSVESESRSVRRNSGAEGGKQKEKTPQDDDDVDDVKKLITVTLILVIITLVLMAISVVYILRILAKD